jgi:hypothetical protein
MSGLLWFSTVREGLASRLRCMATTPFASMQQCQLEDVVRQFLAWLLR